MKRLLFILSFLMLCSCNSDRSGKIDSTNVTAHKFVYSSHSYIVFHSTFDYGFEVLHDPDCPFCSHLNN